ncbi:MAG: chromosomal replication initiator protein DnaA [Firmicutes bacterium GWF2_51_9]|nr:MAG: chromosomal replication initiator protein DnaA [Firmicutes bacterium GWF2_51_9]OGS58127.1 MAG: chromosomal replication initiator protein DnaA [Firmicutes bacterium GWE2_51_13]HAM62551.1 chromosomal replication initiator protein DnaA [Erysipelotrichaceae bacterium]HBZ42101.1 chromosomal replication initiator protein DnaA [Erysipelotrichaceae bacterium]
MNGVEFLFSDIWSKTKSIIKDHESIGKIIYDTYFDDSKLIDLNSDKAVIVVPTNLQKMVLSQRLDLISQSLEKVLNRAVSCEVIMQNNLKKIQIEDSKPEPYNDYLEQDNVLPFYTFDNFVVGPSNKEVHSAALACAYNPGKFYTPLFIFGNSGLGKTHLVNAIGNYIKKNDPAKRVYYTSSSDFVSKVVNSIKNNSIEEFKRSMNELDVLLVDDIQFLAGKEKSHEIFFHIFNELVNNRKQIVLTSDRDPSEIKGLEERMVSRFSSGLSVGIDSPEFETSLAILRFKMENQSMDAGMIDEEVLNYIATNFSKDVRKLEGALNRLIFYSINFGNNERIDFKTALGAFKGSSNVDKNELNANKIKRIVADYYGLTRQQLISKSRTKNIANARHIAMYLCRKTLDLPFIRIGEEFGKRDHSTVMNACMKVEENIKKDINFKQALLEIERQFTQ